MALPPPLPNPSPPGRASDPALPALVDMLRNALASGNQQQAAELRAVLQDALGRASPQGQAAQAMESLSHSLAAQAHAQAQAGPAGQAALGGQLLAQAAAAEARGRAMASPAGQSALYLQALAGAQAQALGARAQAQALATPQGQAAQTDQMRAQAQASQAQAQAMASPEGQAALGQQSRAQAMQARARAQAMATPQGQAAQVVQAQAQAEAARAQAAAAGTPQGQQALADAARAQRAAAQAQERATREVGMGQRAGMAGVRAGVAAAGGSVSGVAGALGEFAGGAAGGPVGAAIGGAIASAAGGIAERVVAEVERTRAVANPNAVGTREMSADLLRATAGGVLGRGDMQAAAVSQQQAAYLEDLERQARETFGERTVGAARNFLFGPAQRPALASFAGLPPSESFSPEQASMALSGAGLQMGPLEQATENRVRKNMEDTVDLLKDVVQNTAQGFPSWGK